MVNLVVLTFLLVLPQPWQTMHVGQSWQTHGWVCVVHIKQSDYMSWSCVPVNRINRPLPPQSPSKEPCNVPLVWPTSIHLWQIPPGCYGLIYYEGYGDCFGWVRHIYPDVMHFKRHKRPRAGAVVYIPPHDQGASAYGHWAIVVAVDPHGRWALISEENNYWRGGGYNRVDYRFLYLDAGLTFLW